MGPLSTRASTSAQPETLQRVSSVLDTIQHPTSFLPSAHFVFAEMSFIGFTLTSDFLQSKGYRSYQKNAYGNSLLIVSILFLDKKNFFYSYLVIWVSSSILTTSRIFLIFIHRIICQL